MRCGMREQSNSIALLFSSYKREPKKVGETVNDLLAAVYPFPARSTKTTIQAWGACYEVDTYFGGENIPYAPLVSKTGRRLTMSLFLIPGENKFQHRRNPRAHERTPQYNP